MLKNLDTKTKKHFISNAKEKFSNYKALPFFKGTDENIYFETFGFNHTGNNLSVFSKQADKRTVYTWSTNKNVVTLKSCLTVIGVESPVTNTAHYGQDCFFNPQTNSIMNLVERKLEKGLEISIKAFWLYELGNKFNTTIDFGSAVPLLVLTYEGINQYRCFATETKRSNFLVLFASGYKYGFKAYHVDFSEGTIVDLLQYNHSSLMHLKRIKIDKSVSRNLTFDIGKVSQTFVGSTAQTLNIYLFCGYHKKLIEISNNGANEVVYDIVENSSIKLFKHCFDSTFIYITEEAKAKIINFQSGISQTIREISFNADGYIRVLSLFQKFSKLLLCMQNSSGDLLVIDLLSGGRIVELPLNKIVISSLQMNWNMEELAVTDLCEDKGMKSIHVFKIPQSDLSLKNLARISILTNFTQRELLFSPLPEEMKDYLAL